MFGDLLPSSWMRSLLVRGRQGGAVLTASFLLPCSPPAVTAPTHSSLWQFQRMVRHITGRSAFFSYYRYGCYRGLGGRGTPVDDTDRCCLAHDCCYERLKQLGCQPVLNSYQFQVVNGTVVCECSPSPGVGCLRGLRACECDKQSMYCFKDSLPTYEKNFKQFSSRPRCGRRKLQC